MKITEEKLKGISDMVRLNLTEEEETRLKKDLNRVVDFIESMNEMDTDYTEPMTYVHSLKNVYREDRAINNNAENELHANASDFTDTYYVVPRILE